MADTYEVTAEEEAELKAGDIEQETAAEEPVKEEVPSTIAKPLEQPKEQPKEAVKQKTPEELEKIVENLNKALKETRHEYRDHINSFKSDFEKLRETLTKKEAPAPPDPAQDPLGYQEHQIKELDKKHGDVIYSVGELRKQQELQQIASTVTNAENQFRTLKPDYDAAYKHLIDFKAKELEEFGVTDQEQIAAELNRVAISISMTALKNGKNPAEIVYNLAHKYGYKAPIAQPEQKPKTALEHIETVANGQKVASKMPGGEEVETKLSVEAMLKLSGAEFDKAWDEYHGIKK